MFSQLFFGPALWLLRRMGMRAKFIVLALCGAAALAVMHWSGAWLETYWLQLAAPAVVIFLFLYGVGGLYMDLAHGLHQLLRVTRQATQGDLTSRAVFSGRDELSALGTQLDAMVLSLSAMVADVRSNAALVAQAGHHLTEDQHALSVRTEQQAASVAQTVVSVEQVSATVQNNSGMAKAADAQTLQVRQAVEQGAQAMERAVHSVEAIEQSAGRMNEIIGVIDGIAFQTNILALNAAVEAARAGEQGRGFAVVASEVRSLAQRSSEAAKEISQLIGNSVRQVGDSTQMIRKAGAEMAQISQGMHSVAQHVTAITEAGASQGLGLEQISLAVHQIDQVTQDNAQMVHQAVRHAQTLEERAVTLTRAVARFRLQQGTAEEAQALVERAQALRRMGMPLERYWAALTDPGQPFHDRDMYVFVLDADGRYLAFGGNPARVGSRVQDAKGVDGQQLLNDIIGQAEKGPGWVEYAYLHPDSGKVLTKMSFVCKQDGVYLGCGIYKEFAGG
ncbi:MAG: methyl-accepting chemotaxis protein [Acidovorax sp.]|jgi:methyl-accepting chemotaxis protein|nr:methyl-accepting chemotaxis protein [Acidovorax sp.]